MYYSKNFIMILSISVSKHTDIVFLFTYCCHNITYPPFITLTRRNSVDVIYTSPYHNKILSKSNQILRKLLRSCFDFYNVSLNIITILTYPQFYFDILCGLILVSSIFFFPFFCFLFTLLTFCQYLH